MALSYTMTGPRAGRAGKPSAPFELLPSEVTTDTVTLGVVGVSGTFNPPQLDFLNSDEPVFFTFTSSAVGNSGIMLTSALGAPITPPILVYVAAATSRVRGLKWVPHLWRRTF
jgi:hypothetical protein